MKTLNYTTNTIDISFSKEELELIRSLVFELYAGVCIDEEEFETVSGIRNPKMVSQLETQLDFSYRLMQPIENELDFIEEITIKDAYNTLKSLVNDNADTTKITQTAFDFFRWLLSRGVPISEKHYNVFYDLAHLKKSETESEHQEILELINQLIEPV